VSVQEAAALVGTERLVKFEQVRVRCRIWDVKQAWGETRVLVTPINGSGEQWVSGGRLLAELQKEQGE
jgi:hypothetical protein